MSSLRIVHLISGLGTGGAEMMLLKLLSRTRLDATVVSMTGTGTLGERVRDSGAALHTLDMASGVPDPRGIWRLAALLREERPHVIQTWMYHADLLGGIVGSWMHGVPVVWNIRQSDLGPGSVKRSTRWTAVLAGRLSRRLPDRIVCCSRTALKVHADLGYAADRITLIPNGFDLDAFHPDSAARAAVRRELQIPPEAPVVGLVARFDPQKDHRNFLEAAALLHRTRPDTHFVLCGPGVNWLNAQLVTWLRSSDVPEARLRLLGDRRDVARITAAVDVATSASYGEGFPNAIGEAMACGIPAVVTDAGDSADLVAACGVVVPSRDPSALAEAWRRVLEMERETRVGWGIAARDRIAEHFSLDSIASRYDALHEEVAGRTIAGPSAAAAAC